MVVTVMDAESGETAFLLKGHQAPVRCVCVSPDGRWVVSGGEDRTVRIWDADTGRGIRTLFGHANTVNAVCVSPDGRWIVSGSRDTTVRVWDGETGRCAQMLEGHANSVGCVTVGPDGRRIVSGSDDRTVKIWECDPARLNQPPSASTSSASSSPQLTAGSVKAAAVELFQSAVAGVSSAGAGSAQSSPLLTNIGLGGGVIASASMTPEDEGHGDVVRAIAVSPDGRFVTSAGADSTVRVWSVERGRLVRVIETRSLNVGTWEEAAVRVAKAEALGLTDGGAAGLPVSVGVEEEVVVAVEGGRSVTRTGSKRGATVVKVNGVSVRKDARGTGGGDGMEGKERNRRMVVGIMDDGRSMVLPPSRRAEGDKDTDAAEHEDSVNEDNAELDVEPESEELILRPTGRGVGNAVKSAAWVLGEDGWVSDRPDGTGTRRLWIPESQRGILVSFQERIIAIGTPAGQVVIIHV
ncbi:hypothetical protein HK101_009575 [Irineochytrium annulatum]|nr:hypothetical protein HK101_009575 [Irineochytrium annulatum]